MGPGVPAVDSIVSALHTIIRAIAAQEWLILRQMSEHSQKNPANIYICHPKPSKLDKSKFPFSMGDNRNRCQGAIWVKALKWDNGVKGGV